MGTTPYNILGKSGLKVSRIRLGMMTYGSADWREWVLEEEAARPARSTPASTSSHKVYVQLVSSGADEWQR